MRFAMRSGNWNKLAVVVLGSGLSAGGFALSGEAAPETAARRAAGGDPEAVAALRETGPAGVEELLALAAAEPGLSASPTFEAALDGVCAQKDCSASHLYWYTDLAAAREAAQRSGRPILSLRLLGRLDEELSCANSRFFRAVLYANESVAKTLRERFVLHWQSERPVPKVTVDFGDGRRLEGTVTGNSIHYVLDSRGRLVDALPGLYGPGAFLKVLGHAETEARRVAGLPDRDFAGALRDYHRARLIAMHAELTQDLRAVGSINPERTASLTLELAQLGMDLTGSKALPVPVPATERETLSLEVSRLAVSKSFAEAPLLAEMSFDRIPGDGLLPGVTEYHAADAVLDSASRRLLRRKLASWVGPDLEESLTRFEYLLAEDSVRNEYRRHAVLHGRLAQSPGVPDLAEIDRWVYAELFRMPAADPWMGLAPREVFAVLLPPEDEAVQVASAPAGR